MTSQINPNNINGAYPVAGQDNNSQGFRDNFTNTGTNFQYAANEITDLQNKVIVSSQLTGGNVLSTQNNMLGSPLINALFSDIALAAVPLGAVGGTVTINYAAGHYQTLTTNSAIVLGFNNWPASGQAGIVTLQITVSNVAHTLYLPTAVTINKLGITGYNPGTNLITFATTGTYTFQFVTSDGGSTITINNPNSILQPLNASSEVLTNGAAASLGVTDSHFSTTGSWTATLANGVAGQVKTFTMHADGGDMVVTVSAAGWKTGASGTITFTAVGQACTLRFNATASAWYCTGNNGATFA